MRRAGIGIHEMWGGAKATRSFDLALLQIRKGSQKGRCRATRQVHAEKCGGKPGTDGTFSHSQRWPNPKACCPASPSDSRWTPALFRRQTPPQSPFQTRNETLRTERAARM